MRTCQQCDKIYLRSAAGQVKAHFVGISGIRTRCADLQIEFTPALATFSDSESDCLPQYNSRKFSLGISAEKKTGEKKIKKKLKSKSKCKPDYHKNGRRATALTRGHILNVNRRRSGTVASLVTPKNHRAPSLRWCQGCCWAALSVRIKNSIKYH